MRRFAAIRSTLSVCVTARSYSDSASTASKNFLELLRKKGHQGKGTLETDLTPAALDKILAGDAELRSAFDHMQRKLDGAFQDVRQRQRSASKPPVKVAVTGAAGAIGYAALFRIASGQMLGPDQPVHLQLLELPQARQALDGVMMELNDCAFPLVKSMTGYDDPVRAFEGADFALLIGAKPRSKGMERADLLKANSDIFKVQGAALNKSANRDTLRVVVVGNPANTNAWIAATSAPDISPTQFSAMTRLDHDRGLAQLSAKTGASVNHIERFAIWGNHSNTMVPDVSHTRINDKWAKEVLDAEWLEKTFTPTVQNRGAQIIAARGASSAASAANAAIQHMRDWVLGTNGQWTSMAVWSDGSYGAEKGIYYSFPVVCADGNYTIVQNVPIDPPTAKKMEASNQELIQERDTVAGAMGIKKETHAVIC